MRVARWLGACATLTAVSVGLLQSASAVAARHASPPVAGVYTLVFTCTSVCNGAYEHRLTIASYSASSGSFSGHGSSVTAPGQNWTISGSIKGGKVTFHIAYTTGNPGYTVDGTGTVAPDGSMSGTASDFDQKRPVGTLTWSAEREAGSKLHVGSVKLSSSERVQRLERELKPQVLKLLDERQAIDDGLATQGARLERANKRVADLYGQLPGVAKALDETSALSKQITADRSRLPAAVRNELLKEERVAENLGAVQIELLDAEENGDPAAVQRLRKQAASLQRLLDQYDSELRPKLREFDDTFGRWLDKLRTSARTLFDLRRQLIEGLAEQASAAGQVAVITASRTRVDSRLNDLTEQLASVEFLPELVTVTGPDGKVFEADISKAALELADVEAKLAQAKQAAAELARIRKLALADFIAAEKRSGAALEALSGPTGTIMVTAYKKAAVDTVYNAYDVLRAGAKGGLAGAFTESLKKLGEMVVKEYFERGPGNYGFTGLKELDDDYVQASKLTNQYFGDQLLKTGGERLAKDLGSGVLKDELFNRYGAAALQHWWEGVPLPGRSAGSAPVGYLEQFKKEAAWLKKGFGSWRSVFIDHQKQMKDLAKGSKLVNALSLPESRGGLLKGAGGDLVAGFMKDVSKNVWKGYYDLQEQKAWIEYYEREAVARALFLPWQEAKRNSDRIEEYVEALEAERSRILAAYDREPHPRVPLDKSFDAGTKLVITLQLQRPDRAKNVIDFDVKIGGRAAKAAGAYTYSVDTTGLTAVGKGLGLEITAR